LGAQADRQQLTLELDFSSNPPSLNAVVVDRVSVPPQIAQDGIAKAAPVFTRNTVQISSLPDFKSGNLSKLAGRYIMAASEPLDVGVSGSSDRRVYVLTQVLPSGRVLWVSRLAGFSGSGSAGFRMDESGALCAPLYEGRLIRSAKLHQSHSLLAVLRWDHTANGLWRLTPSVGARDGVIERQSAYVAVTNRSAEYSKKFQAPAAGTEDFNWASVTHLDLSAGNFCWWNGATKPNVSCRAKSQAL
jgi:hypothetical protein